MFCGIFWMDYEFNKSLKFIINLIKRDLFCYYYLLIECFDKSWSFSCNVVMLWIYCESLYGYWFICYWFFVNFEINFFIGLVWGGMGLDILV